MDWTDKALLVVCSLPSLLTCLLVARTLTDRQSAPPAQPKPSPSESESYEDGDATPQVWADDVLAEEELKTRKTAGAASHSSDVCTYWDEEDERQAAAEQVARMSRSLRSP